MFLHWDQPVRGLPSFSPFVWTYLYTVIALWCTVKRQTEKAQRRHPRLDSRSDLVCSENTTGPATRTNSSHTCCLATGAKISLVNIDSTVFHLWVSLCTSSTVWQLVHWNLYCFTPDLRNCSTLLCVVSKHLGSVLICPNVYSPFQFLSASLRPALLSQCCPAMRRINLQAWGGGVWVCGNICTPIDFRTNHLCRNKPRQSRCESTFSLREKKANVTGSHCMYLVEAVYCKIYLVLSRNQN